MNDISLEDYIAVKSKNAVFVPHTAGRYQKKRFRKAQCPIVERYTSQLSTCRSAHSVSVIGKITVTTSAYAETICSVSYQVMLTG